MMNYSQFLSKLNTHQAQAWMREKHKGIAWNDWAAQNQITCDTAEVALLPQDPVVTKALERQHRSTRVLEWDADGDGYIREYKVSPPGLFLKDIGTPWAEEYRGSGRLTGHLAAEPTRYQNGDVAPGWRWVGEFTEQEFSLDFERELHGAFHTPNRPDWACPICDELRWNEAR